MTPKVEQMGVGVEEHLVRQTLGQRPAEAGGRAVVGALHGIETGEPVPVGAEEEVR